MDWGSGRIKFSLGGRELRPRENRFLKGKGIGRQTVSGLGIRRSIVNGKGGGLRAKGQSNPNPFLRLGIRYRPSNVQN